MKTTTTSLIATIVTISWLGTAALSPTVLAANDLKASTKSSSLTLEAAQVAANAALKTCQQRGAMVAVTVVDRSGLVLVTLRDTLAGMHTLDAATRKAWTAVSFKNSTTELVKLTAYNQANSGIRNLPNVAMIGGGLLIQEAGSIIGGIGVSGAPGGDMDDDCAKAGVAAIQDAIDLN
ncbi:GlcG/HbpS family heme-binding protein [Undibacterium sp. Di24W]|uniref:GlcG/HbpS family heme-binding protein n=1 Tax=Undibacterium sp. Di24W TaxID=3413033 RepID=UPI003BF0E892